MSDRKTTYKAVIREIEKTQKAIETRTNKITALKDEISELKKLLGELGKQKAVLWQDEFQKKIDRDFIKKGVVTEDDIISWLESQKKNQSKPEQSENTERKNEEKIK